MLHKHTISFKHAFDGVLWAVRTQPNFRIHLVLSVAALVLGRFYNITGAEQLTILVLITVGLVIEMINTAIEATTDAIDMKMREDIKIAKDVAAGAMLVYAIGATVIAGMIFVPRIFNF